MKYLLGLLIGALLALGACQSKAAVCGSYPFVFVNGQTANAIQVNGDFNWIQTCLNNTNVNTFAALRANTAVPPSIIVAGANFPADGLGGLFIYNPLDTTSADNGSTIIVDSAGHRWYRQGGTAFYFAGNVTTLEATPIAGFSEGFSILLTGYRTQGDAPPVLYTLDKSACSLNGGAGDGGSQFPSTTPGNCWLVSAQTVWDPRNFGAYGDVHKLHNTVATNGTTAVTVTLAPSTTDIPFFSTDATKLITITNGSQTVANGASYQGSITSASCTPAPIVCTLSVNPAVSFTTNSTQWVAWGHDDTVATTAQPTGPVNALFTFLANINIGNQPAGQPEVNAGGLSYGVFANPVNSVCNCVVSSMSTLALGIGNLPVATTGVFEISGSFQSFFHVTSDANFLPVNACYSNANGTIFGSNLRCKNSLGSTTAFTFTGSTVDAAFFKATIQSGTCSVAAPFICTMSVTEIDSQGLTGGTLVAGTGYTPGDRVIMVQSGGTPAFPTTCVVTNITGPGPTGPAAGCQIQEGGAYTSNPSSFTQSSTTHSDGTLGAGTGLGYSGPTFANNTIQAGLAVTGGGVPNGTMIIQNGTLGSVVSATVAGTGGLGTYLVENLTTNPSVAGTPSFAEMSLDIRVPACSPQLYASPVTPTNPGVDLVSHGNVTTGIYDRTFIAACPNSRTIVLNKPPIQEFSGQLLTFYEDANGIFLGPRAGLQITGLTVSDDDYTGNINDHYGAGMLSDAAGGSSFTGCGLGFHAANLVLGPDSANNQFRDCAEVGVAASGTTEWNSPAVMSTDGAQNVILENFAFGGQVQFFAVTGGITSTPLNRSQGSNTQIAITNNSVFSEVGQVEYAPNNTYWFYTEQPAAGSGLIAKTAAYKNENTPIGNPFEMAFTTGGGGSQGWASFNATQMAVAAQQMNVILGLYNQPYAFTGAGISLATGPLGQAECPYVNIAASYQFTEQDSGTCFDLTGTASVVLTIPLTLAGNSVMSATPSAWHVNIFNRFSTGSAAVQAPTGVTLYSAGSAVTSVSMTNLFKYTLDCIRNTTGVLPFCYIGKSN